MVRAVVTGLVMDRPVRPSAAGTRRSRKAMRWLIVVLLAVWGVLTAVGYFVVLPDSTRDQEIIRAYWQVGSEGSNPEVVKVVEGYLAANPTVAGKAHPPLTALLAMNADEQGAYFEAFRVYCASIGKPTSAVPALVWSTDDNPARRVQCQLFRVWHLRTFGEPIDIIPDPTNRDITKTIVQCVAGAGPDVIEAYGPAELGQMVSAGVALDVTEDAATHGFGVVRVFPAAVSSIAVGGGGGKSTDAGVRQYAFPCNVGYTVLFYHKDLFRQAGVTVPARAWTMEELIAASRKLMAADPTGRRVGIMGLGAWNMAQWGGNGFFNADKTASTYNNAKTIAAFKAYQDLMYVDKVMPTPAEAASMASSGGANMNAGAESAGASALFAAKVSAMVTDGRWSYVGLAQRNRDRVIAPAVERKIAALSGEAGRSERELLASAMKSLLRDVLVPISPEQMEAVQRALVPEDRARLIEVGVMHTPTMDGTPGYEAAARVAIINRVSGKRDLGVRFLRFLASREYNNQINFTFDSICGVPEMCRPTIKGPPEPMPGLEEFDSPVFVEAMEKYAFEWELSPFIGRARLGMIAGPILEKLTNRAITPEDAAREIEDGLNDQIRANLVRDDSLRALWEKTSGKTFDPERPLREQGGASGGGAGSERTPDASKTKGAPA